MMAKNILEPKQIKQAKPKDKEYLLNDGENLFLRVRPNGSQDWFFIYTFNEKRIKLAIDGSDLTKIREKADIYRKQLKDKINPKQKLVDDEIEKQKTEEAKRQSELAINNRITVNALFNRWESLHLCNLKDKGASIRRVFEKDVLPVIGSMAAEDVRKAHIVTVTNALISRGVNRMSKLILSLMRQMFRFAQDQDIIDNDPTSSIRKSAIGGKDTIRDRYLKDDEIKELSVKLPDGKLLISTECAIWIMLSTCCRIGELCKAEWHHLNKDHKTWKIPAENSKNGKAHTIYLSDFAIQQFERLESIKSSDKWVYPNTRNTNHVCEKSITKQIGDRQLADGREPMTGRSQHCEALKLSGGKWTPHDLRRTGATIMGGLGIRPDVIERCLNHIEQNKMKKTYQHQPLIEEQKQAWKLLGERIQLLRNKNADNVVTLKPKMAV